MKKKTIVGVALFLIVVIAGLIGYRVYTDQLHTEVETEKILPKYFDGFHITNVESTENATRATLYPDDPNLQKVLDSVSVFIGDKGSPNEAALNLEEFMHNLQSENLSVGRMYIRNHTIYSYLYESRITVKIESIEEKGTSVWHILKAFWVEDKYHFGVAATSKAGLDINGEELLQPTIEIIGAMIDYYAWASENQYELGQTKNGQNKH